MGIIGEKTDATIGQKKTIKQIYPSNLTHVVRQMSECAALPINGSKSPLSITQIQFLIPSFFETNLNALTGP